jgi:putative endonuclease
MKACFVYILASKRNGTLYIGVTNDLVRRILEHKTGSIPGFTARYGVCILVYYEVFDSMYDAIVREKRMKKWKRRWKLDLIEAHNPKWQELLSDDGSVLPLPKD